MANIDELNQLEVDEMVTNSRKLYGTIIEGLKRGWLKPTIQAKHQRVYIRKALPGEKIEVEADNASYTATEGQYLVYNDQKNRYLVSEKAYKKYVRDGNMETKTDQDGLVIEGYKPKDIPHLIIQANDLVNYIDLKEFTYFPSGWWGSTDTIKKGFEIVLPFDPNESLTENIKKYEESIKTFPQTGTTKEEVKNYLCSGVGFDCYGLDDGHVDTYAICDRNGTFKDESFRQKANQIAEYMGQCLDGQEKK